MVILLKVDYLLQAISKILLFYPQIILELYSQGNEKTILLSLVCWLPAFSIISLSQVRSWNQPVLSNEGFAQENN